ncbi:MAG: DUF3524 domain-containing protein [Deferrisomatales bacterium]
MRGAAFAFARRLCAPVGAGEVDVLFASSLLDLAHLRAFLPRRVPAVLYFHENQAAYPGRPGQAPDERDLQYAFSDLASALAADAVAFNSRFQKEAFFAALEELVRRMPDARPLWALEAIERKTRVVPLGVRLADIPPAPEAPGGGAPTVLWNHRWEYDKNPEGFFRVLFRLADRGVSFSVAVAGQRFGRVPPVFAEARRRLGTRLVHWGCAEGRDAYVELLARGDVVVSTAWQENFGLSMVEAAYAGAHPLAPHRLSYPEVFPAPLHGACLYRDEEDLERRLEALLTGRVPRLDGARLRQAFAPYDWSRRAVEFDRLVTQVFDSAKV